VVNQITLALKKRVIAERGPQNSRMLNDIVSEVSHDLINLARQWNSIAYPIFSSLPQGEQDTRWELDSSLNPVINGLDGTQIFMDNDAAASIDDGRYWDSTNLRPKTLKEIAAYLKDEIDTVNEALQLSEALGGEGLTEEQKARIGLNIFNQFQASASDSLDGRSKNNQYNITQLAKDIYGLAFTLDGDGAANLVNPIRDMVDAVLELHNGNWDDDIVLAHTLDNDDIIAGAAIEQSKVDKSSSYTELTRATTATHLEEDLNRIRYELGALRGNNSWDSDFANIPYTGAPVSLQGHVALVGTGIAEATNPHGITPADIGLTDDLAAIHAFTGMDDTLDATPDYTNTNFISQNDPLETAIDKLDAQLKLTDDENDAHRAIIDGNPHGVDVEDFTPNDLMDRINLGSSAISADRITDGAINIIPLLTQEEAWDNHLIDITDVHEARAIQTSNIFVNFSGDTSQETFESIDAAFDNRRLEVTYADHNDASPLLVQHNKGKYPLVQIIDTTQQIAYDYLYTVSSVSDVDPGDTTLYVEVEHLDENTFRVWTNSTDGVIVALF
jgi:hypothetical protein